MNNISKFDLIVQNHEKNNFFQVKKLISGILFNQELKEDYKSFLRIFKILSFQNTFLPIIQKDSFSEKYFHITVKYYKEHMYKQFLQVENNNDRIDIKKHFSTFTKDQYILWPQNKLTYGAKNHKGTGIPGVNFFFISFTPETEFLLHSKLKYIIHDSNN